MPWRSVERRKHYCQNGVVRPLRLDHPTVGITCMQATRWLRRDNASDAALHAWPLAKLHLPTNWPHCWPIRSLMRNLRMAAHSMTGHLTMLYGRSRMVVGKFRAVDARKWLGRRVLTLRGFTDSYHAAYGWLRSRRSSGSTAAPWATSGPFECVCRAETDRQKAG
jgi:hypothetical protein